MANNWITITPLLVQGRMTAEELAAFTEVGLSEDQTPEQVLADTIRQIVDKARGYLATAVRKGYLRKMGDSGTVPSRMVIVVCNVIRYEVATRLPGMSSLIDPLRQEQHKADLKYLEGVAAGTPAMEDPEDPETSVSAPSPSICARPKHFSRRQQDGI